MYGYQIVEEIRTQTGEALAFGEGCIYPYLHYLGSGKASEQPAAGGGGTEPQLLQTDRARTETA